MNLKNFSDLKYKNNPKPYITKIILPFQLLSNCFNQISSHFSKQSICEYHGSKPR
jgi:hypothetical protein